MSEYRTKNVHGLGRRGRRAAFGMPGDGGDAESGHGANIAGDIEMAAPANGLTVSPVGWGVLTREASDLRGSGIAGTLALKSTNSNGRGSKLTLSKAFGTDGQGGRDALLVRDTPAGLAANDNGDHLQQRFEARFCIGSAMLGNRSTGNAGDQARPVGGWPRLDLGLAADMNRAGPVSLEFQLEAHQRENTGNAARLKHGIGFRPTARFRGGGPGHQDVAPMLRDVADSANNTNPDQTQCLARIPGISGSRPLWSGTRWRRSPKAA